MCNESYQWCTHMEKSNNFQRLIDSTTTVMTEIGMEISFESFRSMKCYKTYHLWPRHNIGLCREHLIRTAICAARKTQYYRATDIFPCKLWLHCMLYEQSNWHKQLQWMLIISSIYPSGALLSMLAINHTEYRDVFTCSENGINTCCSMCPYRMIPEGKVTHRQYKFPHFTKDVYSVVAVCIMMLCDTFIVSSL